MNLALTSCTSSISIRNYIDRNSPFILTINSIDTKTGFTQSTQHTIPVNSNKFVKLMNWFLNNENGWQQTPASFVTNISVTQRTFRLLSTNDKNGVVISFVDKDKNSKQYTKCIGKGELDFLLK